MCRLLDGKHIYNVGIAVFMNYVCNMPIKCIENIMNLDFATIIVVSMYN